MSKQAGGRGIAKPRIFADTADPDYCALLAAFQAGSTLARATPEADMPGFKFARKEP